jgi:hypothetical protein
MFERVCMRTVCAVARMCMRVHMPVYTCVTRVLRFSEKLSEISSNQ